MSRLGMSPEESSGFGGERKSSVRDYVQAKVLPDLYCELVDLLLRVQKLSTNRKINAAEVGALLNRVVKVEGQISAIPARSLEDALVKLRFLRVEIGAEVAEHQRRMLNEAIAVLKKTTEH